MSLPQEFIDRVQQEVEGNDPLDIDYLVFDEVNIPSLTKEMCKEIEKYSNVQILSLNDCNIKSFEAFPNLPKLEKLMLCGNQLSNLDNVELPKQLNVLYLSENKFQNNEFVKKLSCKDNLEEIDLIGNDMKEDFDKKIFEELPNLKIYNQMDKDGKEVEDDLEESVEYEDFDDDEIEDDEDEEEDLQQKEQD